LFKSTANLKLELLSRIW